MRKREYEFERYQAKLLSSKNKKGKREAMQLYIKKNKYIFEYTTH